MVAFVGDQNVHTTVEARLGANTDRRVYVCLETLRAACGIEKGRDSPS